MNIVEFAVQAAGESVSLHGPMLADWPPTEVETLIALTSEKNKISNAKAEAERLHSQTPKIIEARD